MAVIAGSQAESDLPAGPVWVGDFAYRHGVWFKCLLCPFDTTWREVMKRHLDLAHRIDIDGKWIDVLRICERRKEE